MDELWGGSGPPGPPPLIYATDYELKLCNVLISETRIRFMRLITIFNEILINEVYS
jgi:hypothetical protein